MKSIPAIVPDDDTLAKFNNFCTPLFEQMRNLEKQRQSLILLRDSLLPKLMSGELDVYEIDL